MAAPVGWGVDGSPVWLELERFDFKNRSILVVGSSGAGKTNFVHVLIHSLASRYSPDELRFFYLGAKGLDEMAPYLDSGTNGTPGSPWLPHLSVVDFVEMARMHRLSDLSERFREFLKWKGSEEDKRLREAVRTVRKGWFSTETLRLDYSDFRKQGGKMPRLLCIIDGIDEMSPDANAVFSALTYSGLGIHMVLVAKSFRFMWASGFRAFWGGKHVLAFRGSSGKDFYGPDYDSSFTMTPFGCLPSGGLPVKQDVIKATLDGLSGRGEFLLDQRFESMKSFKFRDEQDRNLAGAVSTTPRVDFCSEDCRRFRSAIEMVSRQMADRPTAPSSLQSPLR